MRIYDSLTMKDFYCNHYVSLFVRIGQLTCKNLETVVMGGSRGQLPPPLPHTHTHTEKCGDGLLAKIKQKAEFLAWKQ